jgi:hypothetical protein
MLFDIYFLKKPLVMVLKLLKNLTSSRIYVLNPILQIYNLGAFTIQKNKNLRYYNRTNTYYITITFVDCYMPIPKKTSCDINKNVHVTLP